MRFGPGLNDSRCNWAYLVFADGSVLSKQSKIGYLNRDVPTQTVKSLLPIRRLVMSLAVITAWLLLFEGTARLFESVVSGRPPPTAHETGWQARFFASLFEWHEPDPHLLWRFKAGLNSPLIRTNSQHLIADQDISKKGPDEYRILVLGDSSPVGLGLKSRELAFPRLLERLLQSECDSPHSVTVVNAAVSGYTSEQITRLLRLSGWTFEPDLVVLYCGNNDASISGPWSDQELMEAQRLKSIRRILSHLASYRILKTIVLSLMGRDTGAGLELKLRVSPHRFADNLADIANDCRGHRCPLIIVKPAVPYLWPAGLQFKVFTRVSGDDGQLIMPEALIGLLGRNLRYCLSPSLFTQLYGQGDVFTRAVYHSAYTDSMAPAPAIARYLRLLETEPNNPLYLNNLGVALWENGEFDSAALCFLRTRQRFVELHPVAADPVAAAAGSPFLYNLGINCLFHGDVDLDALQDTSGLAFTYLDSALQADYFSLRVKEDQWRAIERLSSRDSVTVIDLPRIFSDHGGDRLFIDHCHPTPEGHRIIARELFHAICRGMKAP